MSREFNIFLPRGLKFNIFDLPEDFEEQVSHAFAEYTEGTSDDYTYQDKLSFIDLTVERLNNGSDAGTCINELVEEQFAHEWEENGTIMSEDDVYCAEFMEMCFETGQQKAKLNSHFGTGDHHIYDQIMKVLVQIITIVMNYDSRKNP